MGTWQTVAPLAPLEALPNREHPVGPGVLITRTPDWFREDVAFTRGNVGKLATLESEASLVCTFEADSYGDADPSLAGSSPRSKQDAAIEAIHAAGVALWLERPSGLHFELIVTCEPVISRGASVWSAHPVQRLRPLESYASARLSPADLASADVIATAIRVLPRPSAVWTAARFLSLALTEDANTFWEIRFLDLWVAIEALFGPEDRKDVQKTIAKRIARFLNPTDDHEGRIAFAMAFKSYDWRSAAIHGARLSGLTPREADILVQEAEGILRTTLSKILSDAAQVALFASGNRDAHLKALASGFHPSKLTGRCSCATTCSHETPRAQSSRPRDKRRAALPALEGGVPAGRAGSNRASRDGREEEDSRRNPEGTAGSFPLSSWLRGGEALKKEGGRWRSTPHRIEQWRHAVEAGRRKLFYD